MPLPLPTTNLQCTSTSIGSRGRRSSVDSVATADYHPHLHLGLHEHPQFETISQIRASLADLEKAYSSKPAHTPLSGRIIHVSHYIPFLVRARAEVDYEHREQEREQARSSVAAMAAVARARRAERNAQDRREAVLADMHVKAPEPGLSLGARRASMDTAASRMALHGLDGQDMYALLEENQQRSKQRAGRRAWMAQSAIDHVDSDDNADDGYDPGQDTLKDSFSPIGSPEGVEHVYHSSRHSSVGAAGGAKKVLAPSALARPHLHDEVKACNGIGQAAGVASSPLTASSTSPSSASVSASVSTSAAAAARSYTVGSATAPRQHHDGPFVSDHWILTQRRGHTALNSGVRSLRRTHKQTFIGWPGDVDFAAKAQGDLRTESGHLTEEEKSQIEEALRDLEHWDLSPPTAAADADTSNVSQAAPHASGRSLASADGAVAVQHPKAKTTVAPEPAAALRLHRHFRSAASAAAEERREEYEEEHLDGQVTHGVKYVPVWMGSELAHGFYEGYCKTVLWPLLHYLLWEDVNPVNGAAWDGWAWDAYYEANRAFAQRIAQEYQPGDMVIVHDYHLLLVPKMLRHLCPDAHITLFVHAPFPSSEVFRCLPRRQEILEGMLGADLACFQTFSYSRHFLSSCIRVCGFDASFNAVESLDGQVTSISYNPIGICASNISRDVMSLGVRPKTEAFQRMYSGKKIIVGVDKLDVVRGVLHKLQAFQQLLAAYPEWRGRVVLIQVTAPAAHDSPALEREVSELAAQINSEYGTLAFAPVHHYHQIVDRDEYFALMSVADLSLFTAVRDGMNTTSMEYVISQEQSGKKSPLVLSEFTGTASRIRTALQINPWNTWGVTKAIHQALIMGAEEKEQRHRHAYDLVTLHTSRTWAATLVRQLVYRLHVEETSHLTPELDLEAMQSDWLAAMVGSEPRSSTEPRSGPQCLLLLDYDGTLTPIVRDPEKALPSDRLVAALDKLSADTRNAIFIISGRDQQFLTKHLGHLDNIGFSAEHGSFIKEPGAGEPWINLTKDFDLSWKGDIRAIFEYYTERTSGSAIEEKKSSITWHYRNADPDFGSFQAKECQAHLENMLAYNRLPIEVMVGKKNLEVRPLAVNKGEIVRRILAAHPSAQFVLCAGDDRTDEDMFRALAAVNRAGQSSQVAFSPSHDVSRARSPSSPMLDERQDGARSMDELPLPLAVETSVDLHNHVPPGVEEPNDEESMENIQDAALSSDDGHKSDNEVDVDVDVDVDVGLAPHPWEEAMAVGFSPRGSVSHVGTASPVPPDPGHPFSLYTVTVGPATKKTIAHWHVDNPTNVIDVLAEFAAAEPW